MTIDERLASSDFPLPAIRQINRVKHPTAVGLGLGELRDFQVDPLIIEAVKASLTSDGANYSANAGLPKLRDAIAKRQQKADGFSYTAEHVNVTIGVQNALYAVIKTLSKLGAKRVLIPSIHFGIYRKIPLDFSLEVITYPLTPDFGIDIVALGSIIQPDDLLILNSPSNPTGRVFSIAEMQNLATLLTCRLTNGYVLSDEIYGSLVYEGEPAISFSSFFERTLVLDGISKSAAAAGLRVGWVITRNTKLAEAITSNNSSIISCPPTLNQYAALPVVEGQTLQTIESYNRILLNNRNIALQLLEKNGIPVQKPRGSFYIFPHIQEFIHQPIRQFCISAAQHPKGVVVIPGEAFNAPGFIRISLATRQMEEGMMRLIRLLKG